MTFVIEIKFSWKTLQDEYSDDSESLPIEWGGVANLDLFTLLRK